MSDIFISYSSADRSMANLLADRLDAEGWTVFWDVQTPVGKAWDQAIENQLHTAKAVVVLWSARSLVSNFVKEEAHYGRSQNILFPVFIERVKPPFGFNLLQTANLIGWQGEPDHLGLAQLLDALRGHLGIGLSPSPIGGRLGGGRIIGLNPTSLPQPPIQIGVVLRILVVDDNEINRLVLRELLKSFEADIQDACDGREALDIMLQEPFDMIFLDVQMPHMDGLEVLIRCRKQPGPNRHVPVIAMTPWPWQSEELIRIGFADCLILPIKYEQVNKQVGIVLSEKAKESVANVVELASFPTGERLGWERGNKDEASDLTNSPPMRENLREQLTVELHSTVLAVPTPPASAFITGQTFRDQLKIGGEGPLMVVIPSGRFLMGSPPKEPERSGDEGPQHEVIIKTPFALGVTAVTFADYDLFCRNTNRELPNDRGWGRDNHPVINVSWQDAQAYCAWLSQQTGQGYRLPSEAEWEYACRAGTTTPFSFGGNISWEQVNYDYGFPRDSGGFIAMGCDADYKERTVPVQFLPPNAWGLHEMHGNVWEWVQDEWHDNYDGAPTDGSAWEQRNPPSPGEGRVGASESGAARVRRGGSGDTDAGGCRSASRFHYDADYRSYDTGFRCARVQVVS